VFVSHTKKPERAGGSSVQKRVVVGVWLGGGKHIVDVVAEKDGRRLIVSLKWQQVSGTAEQKVPFEVICLEMRSRRVVMTVRTWCWAGRVGNSGIFIPAVAWKAT
jgi:hypothetical protein